MEAKEAIGEQIKSNYYLNLAYTGGDLPFAVSAALRELIAKIARRELQENEIRDLVEFTCEKALESLYNINQYFQFNRQSESELKMVYMQGIHEVIDDGSTDLKELCRRHFIRFQQWFLKNQTEGHFLFPTDIPLIKNEIVCAEYSAALQLKILGLQVANLQEPVLDIGCGKKHYLINYLNDLGLHAFGIDRNADTNGNIRHVSWFDFNFERNYWGTVISHLGFTNHFLHHHLKQQSLHQQFARTYMKILQSLKKGGLFCYAPALPFIEVFLNPAEYSVAHQRIPGMLYQHTIVQRLK